MIDEQIWDDFRTAYCSEDFLKAGKLHDYICEHGSESDRNKLSYIINNM